MNLTRSPSEIVKMISQLLRVNADTQDGGTVWEIGSRQLVLTDAQLEAIFSKLEGLNSEHEVEIFSAVSYEVLVNRARGSLFSLSRTGTVKGLVKEDPVNLVQYTLSSPSPELIVYHITRINDPSILQILYRVPLYAIQQKFEGFEYEGIEANVWSLIAGRALSVRINSEATRSLEEFRALTNSFLFELSYNHDVSIISQRLLPSYSRIGRRYSFRRSREVDTAAPKRLYREDLVHYYQMAVSSASPSLEYLSFYQIAEYFFESVYEEDLIEKVKQKITDPGFSYHRKRDLKELIKVVTKAVKLRDEEYQSINELRALELTISKYIDIQRIKQDLASHNEDLVVYYSSTSVPFSGGNTVRFDEDQEKVIEDISKRIYLTRNSIVHSKEGKQRRFTPFRDDEALIKELPLLRFVAEAIILSNSQLIKGE